MVVRDREVHRRANFRASSHREDLVANRTDEHQRDLRRENHRSAVLDSVRAKIGHGKCRTFEVRRAKPATSRTLRDFGHSRAQRREVEAVGIVDNRDDQALGRVDCDAEIDPIEAFMSISPLS